MLMQAQPVEQIEKPIELQRLECLLYEVFPLVEEKARQGIVNLNFFNNGTCRCLIGWASVHPSMNALGVDRESLGVEQYFLFERYNPYKSCFLFDLTEKQEMNLFGISAFGTLQERKERLQNIVDERNLEWESQAA